MKVVGAIDIGSNAVRMSCARLTDDGRIEIIDAMRTPVRLGADVFEDGFISPETLEKLAEAIGLYLRTFEQNGCEEIRTYATSAFRETSNQAEVLERLGREGDIHLEAISGGKEAFLLQRAVQEALDLSEGSHVMADLGGGSVEISIIDSGDIRFAESFRVGTVRLLRMFDYSPQREPEFIGWLDRFLKDFTRSIKKRFKKLKVAELILTGGNAVAIGKLAQQFSDGSTTSQQNVVRISREDFKTVKKELVGRGYEERMEALALAPDRADVIVPAVFVFDHLLDLVGAETLVVPDVGVRDGILAELLEEYRPSRGETDYQQIIRSAYYYVDKYRGNLDHARTVHGLAVQLFDGMSPLHGYGHRERTYLEAAAIMHDVGRFVRPSDHHKHSLYLIQNTELVGVTNSELKVIAAVARYHTRATPSPSHPEYAALSKPRQTLVNVLSAILRIADALDREHTSDVKSVIVHCDDKQVLLLPQYAGDLLLPEWALRSKKRWFEEVFSRPLVLGSQADMGVPKGE
jgi:exopolyphosphatase/guanosine-5'-triphosphate,3'-diphosphate pyrophosphatase